MKEKLAKLNQSIEKTFQVIEILANQKGYMRLQDISLAASIPASTVLRLLNTLIQYNYVTQNPETHKYSLTLKFAKIGSMVRSQFSISDIARQYLVDLSIRCNESACLAIEQDMEVVYIDAVDGPDSMLKTMQRIGKRAPLHSTGVGKLMLLNYDATNLNKYVIKTKLAPLTKNTITSQDKLEEELSKIQILNYAFDDEECELGARCVASPIRDYTGKVIAAISVSGPTTRMTLKKIDTIKDFVVETASAISELYAYVR